MIISKTPIRISFTGGGTDFESFYRLNGGAVVSTTIDKYIYVIIKKRFDKKIRVSYTKTEMVDNLNEIQHDLVRETLRITGITQGVEIITLADIPSEGSGLGSSSALTVGLLNAFYAFKGKSVDTMKIAELACNVEIDILGKPIGKQDQYITALGGFRHTSFNKDGTIDSKRINISSKDLQFLNKRLMLFYTGITRSADLILENQKKHISSKLSQLSGIGAQTNQLLNTIDKRDFNKIGDILDKGWLLKKQLSTKITSSTIDDLYNFAKELGATGGKIAGAGGGGFLLLFVPAEYQEQIRGNFPLEELDFNFDYYGTRIITNNM